MEKDMEVGSFLLNNKNRKLPTRRNSKTPTRRNHAPKNIPPRNINVLPLLQHLSSLTQQPKSRKTY